MLKVTIPVYQTFFQGHNPNLKKGLCQMLTFHKIRIMNIIGSYLLLKNRVLNYLGLNAKEVALLVLSIQEIDKWQKIGESISTNMFE